jgi:hypothetical protein
MLPKVVGERIQVRPELIPKLAGELPGFKVRMSKNGEFVEEGSGKNWLKSPAPCLAEVSAAITRRFPSEPLSAGEVVSSGTLTAGHLTTEGDSWKAEVEGIYLPPLALRLTWQVADIRAQTAAMLSSRNSIWRSKKTALLEQRGS